MSHLGQSNVSRLTKVVDDVDLSKPQFNEIICDPCAVRVMKFFSHDTLIALDNASLNLVHSDVVGSFDLVGYNEIKYFVTFRCDHTKFSGVFCIKKKFEVSQCFRQFKASNERADIQVHRLRSDEGGEYISIEFKVYLLENEIQLELTTVDNPQMNGVVERFDQTLLRKTVSTLKSFGLPKNF